MNQPDDPGERERRLRRVGLRGATERILEIQTPSGAIPWFEEGPWDPWNHVECAMALSVMGAHHAAEAAYGALRDRQEADGSWIGEYGASLPIVDRLFISREPAPAFRDSNFTAYVAVGLWHRLLGDRDLTAAARDWPMLCAAMDFVLSLQGAGGEIGWSAEAAGSAEDDALLAGNACIAKSLDGAIGIAAALGRPFGRWAEARGRLVAALRERPERFDRSGRGARYAMDWYYPALCGVLDRSAARDRLARGWARFVEPAIGCRCVEDEPWFTVAETCELAIALAAVGRRTEAARLFEAQARLCDLDGAYWMGWQSEERIFWPQERPSWTQGAAILAADALYGLSPAARALTHSALEAA